MGIIDVTGTPLTPSDQGKDCLGNGKHPEYEICCDECDYFLSCFPEYDSDLYCTDELEPEELLRPLEENGKIKNEQRLSQN